MPVTLQERYTISSGDTEMVSVGYKNLDSGELLTGTPTIVEVTSTDLTLGNKAVSTAALTIKGESFATGEAVQFSVSGQSAGTVYRIRITVGTDATVARTFVRDILLEVAENAT